MTPLETKAKIIYGHTRVFDEEGSVSKDDFFDAMKEISRWTLEQVVPEEKRTADDMLYTLSLEEKGYNECRQNILTKAKEIGIELSTNSSEE